MIKQLFVTASALYLAGCASFLDTNDNNNDIVHESEDQSLTIVAKNPTGGTVVLTKDGDGVYSVCLVTPPGSNAKSVESVKAGGNVEIDTKPSPSGKVGGDLAKDSDIAIDYQDYSREVALAISDNIAACKEQFNAVQLCKYGLSLVAKSDLDDATRTQILDKACPAPKAK